MAKEKEPEKHILLSGVQKELYSHEAFKKKPSGLYILVNHTLSQQESSLETIYLTELLRQAVCSPVT